MNNELLVNKVRDILTGIDLEEHESSDGWWERSGGAAFGKGKLNEVLEAIAGHGSGTAKTETKHVYINFNESLTCGYGYSIWGPQDKAWLDDSETYTFVCAIELPLIDKEAAKDMALKTINRIKALQYEIEQRADQASLRLENEQDNEL